MPSPKHPASTSARSKLAWTTGYVLLHTSGTLPLQPEHVRWQAYVKAPDDLGAHIVYCVHEHESPPAARKCARAMRDAMYRSYVANVHAQETRQRDLFT